MSVKLISITPDAEKLMGFIARVSNPANQDNENVSGLLAYCIKHSHWSVFEQAHITMEVDTTRDIAAQLLRHVGFRFQEFSQRYAAVTNVAQVPELRMQDTKNRQNSIEVTNPELQAELRTMQHRITAHFANAMELYEDMLNMGIAKECARKVLPLNTDTKLYVTGSVRQWIHYIQLRTANGTQKEHMQIAELAKEVFVGALPIVSDALGWTGQE